MSKDAFGPGSRLGIVGSGQLGRMLAQAAKRRGYGVSVYSPDRDTPAGSVADREFSSSYHDEQALTEFARSVDVVTFEFENIDRVSLDILGTIVPVRPSVETLFTFQHRLREKTFLKKLSLPLPKFAEVKSEGELKVAVASIGLPAVLKTAGFGYDGKGQVKINDQAQIPNLGHLWNGESYVLEEFVTFGREVSMVAARSIKGEFVHYGLIENVHKNHILDTSAVPAAGTKSVKQAEEIVRVIFDNLQTIGLMCVEFFEISDGDLLINEVAPRTHNSGHLTIDACKVSQFEQQLQAVCGLPLEPCEYKSAAAMVNLLGDLWEGGEPNWSAIEKTEAILHLYGKKEPRVGRKMGHINVLAKTASEAKSAALKARELILKR